MIQRKQTLFLLISLALLIAMLFMPLATSTITPKASEAQSIDGTITSIVSGSANEVRMDMWGLYYDGVKQVSFTYFFVLLFLTIATVILCILMYRHRLMQIKLCYILWIFILGLLIFSGVYFYRLQEIFTNLGDYVIATSYSSSLLFPLISLILVWFAYKGIIRDEALVRSLDRIR